MLDLDAFGSPRKDRGGTVKQNDIRPAGRYTLDADARL